jgi:hypothetical protein
MVDDRGDRALDIGVEARLAPRKKEPVARHEKARDQREADKKREK